MRALVAVLSVLILSACGPQGTGRPAVLIIGDSISLGYTPYVQERIPNVEHAPQCLLEPYQQVSKMDNSEGSAHQAACIRGWLAGKHYDIVHFNAGIWDADTCGSNQARNLSDYLANLQTELDAIREVGATPIFATTTPVPMPNESCADESLIERYNAAAVEMMRSQGVEIDDLYSLMESHPDLHKSHDNVHWKDSGYELMADQVSNYLSHW